MPASLIPVSSRYFMPEITKVLYLPAIAAATLTPTNSEINAGTDLSREIADVAGWTVASGQIPTPDLGTRFVSQIGGRITAAASSLTFYADVEGVDVRDVLPRDTDGFIMWADGGLVATQPADVFPITVTSLTKLRGAGDEASRILVEFAITAEPAEDITIPTLS